MKMLSRYTTRWSLRTGFQCRELALGVGHQRWAPGLDIKKKNIPTSDINFADAHPFEDIPGPTTYQFIRGLLPGGFLHNKSVYELLNTLRERYGIIFRIPGLFGRPTMYACQNPDDFATIFRNEGQWPFRLGFDTIMYHREVLKKDFFQGVEGIVTTSGEKWAKMRTAVNPILMQPKNVQLYLKTMLEVNDEFLARIRDIRDPKTQEMPATFEDDINRLTFESVAAVALNTQLGLIRKNRDSPESRTILEALTRFFDLLYELEVMPSIWKIVKTPKFKEFVSTMDVLTNICTKYINEALARIEHDEHGKLTTEVGKEKSVLEKLLRVDKHIAIVMALDMMMSGVDTTSTTLTGILLCIAKNPEKQAKLFGEIKQILPEKNSQLTVDNMHNLPYLRACIKEGMRLYPVFPGTSRRLPVDVVLSGYQFRKGTDVAINSTMLLRNEKFVPRPNEFLPERFLRDAEGKQNSIGEISHPFVFLPFGFGPRSCVGKRIVELELEITIARLVRNFHIEFNHSIENAFKAKLIYVPNIPLKFKFEERKE